MPKCLLTSAPELDDALNPNNGFTDRLKKLLPGSARALFICSDPDSYEKTDFFSNELRRCFERSGFSFAEYVVLDHRNVEKAAELVRRAELVILAGGHVPTQNRFFQEIGLKEIIQAYEGVVVGISAGSMNSASVVYAQPEREGEAVDPRYQRFLCGLGLTDTMLLPHYQDNKDDVLDGMRIYEDIAFSDSIGREFYVIPDGTYLYTDGETEELCGEAWLICDGSICRYNADGEIKVMRKASKKSSEPE